MFQLIVSVIAIALVAILAAASIYYGGSAFSNSTAKGNVAALINAGQQIAGANALYKVDKTVSTNGIAGLVADYLSAVPTAPRFATGAWEVTGETVVNSSTVNGIAYIGLAANSKAQVCTEVVNQGGASVAGSGTPAASDLITAGKQFGCVGDFFAYRM